MARHGQTVVYRAWQPAFERRVEVRLLTGTTLAELEADARRTAPLAGHPNVVAVHELGVTSEGTPYLVTELLERIRAAEGGQDWHDAARLTIGVAGVLAAAAQAGVGGLAVTPDDVLVSRFGDPKLVVLGRAPAIAHDDVEALRSLLRDLLGLGPVPAPLSAALADPDVADAEALARRLQRAQAEAGRPVTELPVATPGSWRPGRPDDARAWSQAITVAPAVEAGTEPPRWRRPARAWAAGGVVALGATLATVLALVSGGAPAVNTPPPAASPSTSPPASSARPEAVLLHTADLTSARGWSTSEMPTSRATVVDGEYRLGVHSRGGRLFSVWGTGQAERRLSTSVAARITEAPLARFGVICGAVTPGEKHLIGWVRPDGEWEVEANGGVVAGGTDAQLADALRRPFTVRFDCFVDQHPTRAKLSVNDRLVGEADGREPFPLTSIGLAATTKGPEPFDVAVTALTVHRLA